MFIIETYFQALLLNPNHNFPAELYLYIAFNDYIFTDCLGLRSRPAPSNPAGVEISSVFNYIHSIPSSCTSFDTLTLYVDHRNLSTLQADHSIINDTGSWSQALTNDDQVASVVNRHPPRFRLDIFNNFNLYFPNARTHDVFHTLPGRDREFAEFGRLNLLRRLSPYSEDVLDEGRISRAN